MDLFRKEEVLGLFVFENTASAQKLIIVIGVKVIMTQDLLLLAVLRIRLEEWIESAPASPLGWKLILVSWVRLRSAIAHNKLFSNELNYVKNQLKTQLSSLDYLFITEPAFNHSAY